MQAVLEQFGPVLYNIYGSTEVALATVATPEDLRVAPSTAGRVALGSTVKILDDEGREVPSGTTGRVFVGSGAAFEGYTGGGTKEVIDGLMSSGDVGHFDAAGRLFVDGRDDDMIVSGGENVFPAEVEDLLAAHPSVAEAAVVGVADDAFGQVLAAFIVKRPGAKLTKKDVGDHVKAHLARYKVPRHVTFLKALPRTETGKVRKRDLRAVAIATAPRNHDFHKGFSSLVTKIPCGNVSVEGAEGAAVEVGEGLADLVGGVHHERAVADDRLVDRLAAEDQEAGALVGRDGDALAVVLEHDELAVVGLLRR